MEQSASEPDAHAAVSEVVLTKAGAVLRVRVPASHHAYLDKGPAGAFIPIAPDWDSLVKAGRIKSAPALSRSPGGTLDKDSGAMVLRGTGEFEYTGNLTDLAGETIQVRTQVCDDIKGICYRPKTENVTIQKL